MKKINNYSALLILFFLIFNFFSSLKSQVRIGFQSSELESPEYSILEFSVKPIDANKGKGILLPRVTKAQMLEMQNDPTVQDGMILFNLTDKVFMIKQNGAFLTFVSKLDFQRTKFLDPESYFDGTNSRFMLASPPFDGGTVLFNYNHSSLIENVDFVLNGPNVSFITMFPDNKKVFSEVIVER